MQYRDGGYRTDERRYRERRSLAGYWSNRVAVKGDAIARVIRIPGKTRSIEAAVVGIARSATNSMVWLAGALPPEVASPRTLCTATGRS